MARIAYKVAARAERQTARNVGHTASFDASRIGGDILTAAIKGGSAVVSLSSWQGAEQPHQKATASGGFVANYDGWN
jgi:hypothetical protein